MTKRAEKATITTIIVVLTIFVLCMFCGTARDNGRIYHKSAEVIGVDYTTDEVVCVDAEGNEWAFYGADEYMEGDAIVCVMYDNNTEATEDDIIANVRVAQ